MPKLVRELLPRLNRSDKYDHKALVRDLDDAKGVISESFERLEEKFYTKEEIDAIIAALAP